MWNRTTIILLVGVVALATLPAVNALPLTAELPLVSRGDAWQHATEPSWKGCPHFENPGTNGGCGFTTGVAPFSNNEGLCPGYTRGLTNWPSGENLYVWKEVTTSPLAKALRVQASADNAFWFYLQGANLGHHDSDAACQLEHDFRVDLPASLRGTTVKIAFQVEDYGGLTYFDAAIRQLI